MAMRVLVVILLGLGAGRCFAAAKPVLSCSAEPGQVTAGEAVTVTVRGMDLPDSKRLVYQWTASGGVVAGDGTTASVETKGLAGGTYTVSGRLLDEKKGRIVGACSADFVVGTGAAGVGAGTAGVGAVVEPVGTGALVVGCGVSRAAVHAGEPVTVTATPTGSGLSYGYAATHGTVVGDGASALLSTSGVAGGGITVSCTVTDGQGRVGVGRASLVVAGPVVLPSPPAGKGVWPGGEERADPRWKVSHSKGVAKVGRGRRWRRRCSCPCACGDGELR